MKLLSFFRSLNAHEMVTKRLIILACCLLLAVQAAVQVRLARTDSQTTDEAVHLSAGYTYLTQDDFRFNPEHPPLVKVLAALPLLALPVHPPADAGQNWEKATNFFYDSWRENRAFGQEFFYAAGNNPDQMLFWARLPMVALTFLLGLTILAIAWQHWGQWAALVAVGLYALDPTVAAHGHLITTDIALAFGYLLTIYSFWRFIQKPTWLWAAAFGGSFGLALLSKHTAIIVVPALGVLAIGAWLNKSRVANWRTTLPKFLVSLVVVWALIWTGYGWHDRVAPKVGSASSAVTLAGNQSGLKLDGSGQGQAVSIANPKIDRWYNRLQPVLRILPGDYAKGLFLVITHVGGGQDSFLLGQTSKTGWWYYFPVLLLFKTPLATLLVIGGALYLVVRKRSRDSLATTLTWAAAIFLTVALTSKADLGIRHVLPIFPPLFLVAGWAASQSQRWRNWVLILLVWLVAVFALNYPMYLGYYNQLAGGSNNGYLIATDSNLDWGQDLHRINDYIQAHQLVRPYVEYGWDGNQSLGYYLGSNYQLLTDVSPPEGATVIIGASAYNQLRPTLLKNCRERKSITSGTFVCQIKN